MFLKRYSFLLALLLATSGFSYGQSGRDTVLLARRLTTVGINYLGVAVAQERGLGARTTLLYGLGAHYSFYGTSYPILGTRFINVIDKTFGRDYSTAGITPYAFLEARVYTNLLTRFARGKNTRHNAGTYLAVFGELPFASGNLIEVPNLELGYPIGLKLGLRRSLGTHLYGEGSVALVNVLSDRQSFLKPRLDVSLAWVL
jgi:hypothetical protein